MFLCIYKTERDRDRLRQLSSGSLLPQKLTLVPGQGAKEQRARNSIQASLEDGRCPTM